MARTSADPPPQREPVDDHLLEITPTPRPRPLDARLPRTRIHERGIRIAADSAESNAPGRLAGRP